MGQNGPMNARSPMVIGGIVVALLVALGTVLLLRTGSGEPPAAAPSQAPTATPSPTEGTPTAAPAPEDVAAQQTTTVLKVRVADCDGCQVTAVPDTATGGQSQYSASVDSGMAQLELPTPNTLGLSFFVQGEKDGNDTPQRTLVLLQPDQIPPGDPVPTATIEKATSAGYCWAGTLLDVATVQFTAETKGATVTRVWADPALPTRAAQVKVGTSAEKNFTPSCAEGN